MNVFNNIGPVGAIVATQKRSGLCCAVGAYWQENKILKSSLDLFGSFLRQGKNERTSPETEFEMPIEQGPSTRMAQYNYQGKAAQIMKLSPNPSNGMVYVAYQLPQTYNSAELILYNNLGQKLNSWDVSNSPILYKLDCESYPAGIYSLSLVVDNKKVETQKLTLITE